MFDEKMEPEIAKGMLRGNSDNLNSSFYINYHMLLNSQRLEDIDVEYILARSLLQFQQDTEVPILKAQLAEKQNEFKELAFDNEEQLEQLYELKALLNVQKGELKKLLYTPQRVLPFLNIGRIIHLVDGDVDWGYAVSINFHKRDSYRKGSNVKNDSADYQIIVDAMVHVKPKALNPSLKPAGYQEEG